MLFTHRKEMSFEINMAYALYKLDVKTMSLLPFLWICVVHFKVIIYIDKYIPFSSKNVCLNDLLDVIFDDVIFIWALIFFGRINYISIVGHQYGCRFHVVSFLWVTIWQGEDMVLFARYLYVFFQIFVRLNN